ncbi:MAG: type I methionyl aminopeptidase [Bacteroides sp.]|jgi:methionine aminopeptidase, type I
MRSVSVKTDDEVEYLRQNNQLVASTLAYLATLIEPGVQTKVLDLRAEEFIRDHGAVPGFKGYEGFPYTLCISVNDVVVHGFPSDYCLQDGDIVSVDCGTVMHGYYGDSAYTFAVGEISQENKDLLRVTRESLDLAIEGITAGWRVGDIGATVQEHVERHGYGIVREMVGHGLGTDMHEQPEVPNYGRKGHGKMLTPNLVICIEPMVTMGKRFIYVERDGWTVRTVDRKNAAHFEKAVAIRKNGTADQLTRYDEIVDNLKKKGAWVS